VRQPALLLAALLALALPAGATAAECPRTSLGAVEAEVMCLVCGTPLALASEAPQANRERALIQRQVDRCRSKEQIEAALVAEYGESVLALPEPEGFNVSAYAVPILAFLLALGGLAFGVRRWRGGSGRASAPIGPSDTAGSKRLDADLERYDL
jgi:cytochrome c-type biogenesis protein CcmH